YSKSILQQGLNSEYIQERLQTNTWYGEAGHPISSDPKRILQIDLARVSHIVRKVWWEGNLLRGEVETARTPLGESMMGLIRQSSRVGFSLRAHGKVVPGENDTQIVEGPIMMLCYDWVIHPS